MGIILCNTDGTGLKPVYTIRTSAQISRATTQQLEVELELRGGIKFDVCCLGDVRHNYIVDQMRSELRDRTWKARMGLPE